MLRRGWVLMDTVRPGEPHVIGDSEEIRRFRDAIRARIERAAGDAGGDLREIPPAVLLSLLCASAFSAVAGEMAEAPTLGPLSSRVVLGDLISAAIDGARARGQGPMSPHDLEREIYRRIERVLTAQDQRATVLRTEIAAVLAETDALRTVLSGAIETGNDRLRNDVISAIDTLSGGYPEMAFLLRTSDHETAQMQRRLDGQGAEFRALGDTIRRQSADVRIARQDLAAVRHRQARAAHGQAADAGGGPSWDSRCPYRGLLPFDQEHAEVFCGRQRLTAELIVKLAGRLAGPSMVVLSGASGAGKSSLLHAGLLPALAAGIQLEGSDGWPRIVMTPTGDPLTELATRLAALSSGDAATIRNGLAADPDRAHLLVGRAVLDRAGRSNGSWTPATVRPGRLILVIDQFEEVFTLAPGRGDAGQQAFIAALCAAASQPLGPRGEPPAVVVIAVRGDYWARCAAHAGLARLMQDGMFVVGPMTGPELREAINGPAAAAGLQVDADLANTVLAGLRTAGQDEAEGILPLLSQTMMLTWQRRDGHRLTVQGYHETGGVARSVEFGAEAVYEALPDAGQQIAREVFQALVVVGPEGQLARRTVPRAELAAGRRDAARRALGTVLEAFASSRLLVLDGDTVQIAHDVLLRAWPRLRGWLDNEQANWILYTQLQEDAAEWAGHGRDSSFLYRGNQLAAVEQAAARWTANSVRYPALTGDQSGFLEASRQHAARNTRTRRAAVLALALLLVLSLVGVGIAGRADRTANQQRNAAVSSQLAAESEGFDTADPEMASLLAAAAWSVAPTAQARVAMLDAAAQPVRAVLNATSSLINAMAFSPDGKILAAASDDSAIRLWDVPEQREIAQLASNLSPADGMTFSPNGHILAVVGYNNRIQLWNVASLRRLGAPIRGDAIAFAPADDLVAAVSNANVTRLLNLASGHDVGRSLPGQAVAFSPNGKIMATADNSGRVLLWHVATQTPAGPPINHVPQPVTQISFSPDGRVLATASSAGSDGTVKLWNIASRREIGPKLTGNTIAFSDDGSILASEISNGIQLWDAASGQQIDTTLTGDMNSFGVSSIASSPDGPILATGEGTGPVRLWDLALYQQLGGPIVEPSVGFGGLAPVLSPDGKQLAVAGSGGELRVLDVASRKQIGASLPTGEWPYTSAAFNPDGKYIATGTDAGQLVLWSAVTGRRITTIARTSNQINQIAFSPNGEFLAVAVADVGVRLWNIRSLRSSLLLDVGNGGPAGLSFNPDGKIVATASASGTIKFWNASTGRLAEAPLTATDQGVSAIAYSPNGSILADAENDGTIQLWNPSTRSQVASFSAGVLKDVGLGTSVVSALAFNPAGTLLATANADGTARLWDLATYQQVGGPLTADSLAASTVAFSPDGRTLATGGGEMIFWDIAFPADPQGLVCQIAGGSLNRQEWHTYAPAEPYRNVCLSSMYAVAG